MYHVYSINKYGVVFFKCYIVTLCGCCELTGSDAICTYVIGCLHSTVCCVLQVLDLSSNNISSLKGLEGHTYLTDINMEDNKVSKVICQTRQDYSPEYWSKGGGEGG